MKPELKTEVIRLRLTPSKRAMIECYVGEQRKAGNPIDSLTKFIDAAIWEYLKGGEAPSGVPHREIEARLSDLPARSTAKPRRANT